MLKAICAVVLLLSLIGCGGGSTHSQSTVAPTPTPTGTPFPNDQHLAQSPPVKLGTTGGNSTDQVNNGKTITCCSGTLGSLMVRGGTFFILSNNHVLDKSDRGAAGDPITQPGLVDNNCSTGMLVARLSQAAALKPANGSNGPAPSNVDAAIAQIVPGTVDTSGSILDLGAAGSASIAAAPPSQTLAVPANVLANGEQVAKSGRHTGLTCSALQSVNTTVSVQYDAACGGAAAFTASFNNQVIINGGNFSATGDSGSLVVTADTARPVGLLYGGNNTSSSANPITDVIAAFSNGSGAPAMVGGGDHPVSCAPQASAPATSPGSGANASVLSRQERQRVSEVRERRAPELTQDPAITAVEVGTSDDSPGEGALLLRVAGTPQSSIPAVIDGVRTKVVPAAGVQAKMPALSRQDMESASAIKQSHAAELMAQPGIQGIGVGRSDDNPAETAIVIYVISGMEHAPIPATLDGVRTKIVEGDRFRAFGWGKKQAPATKCTKR